MADMNFGEIKVKKLNEDAVFEKAHRDDIGYDLKCTSLKYDTESGIWSVCLGVAVEPPPGFYFKLYPRSSFPKYGWFVVNSVGIIDPGYRGEWALRIVPWSNKIYRPESPKYLLGKKIAQAILVKQCDWGIPTIIVDHLSESERGAGGFGSTGT